MIIFVFAFRLFLVFYIVCSNFIVIFVVDATYNWWKNIEKQCIFFRNMGCKNSFIYILQWIKLLRIRVKDSIFTFILLIRTSQRINDVILIYVFKKSKNCNVLLLVWKVSETACFHLAFRSFFQDKPFYLRWWQIYLCRTF